jgi:predicted nucleic acid-binding protein
VTSAFLDTSGWFAALSPREAQHREALATYRQWIETGVRLLTTNLVVAEMQILVTRARGSGDGLRFLDSLYLDPTHTVVFVDRELERAATDRWLRRFRDQRLSLADTVSFELMRQYDLKSVLALDTHFSLAGYEMHPLIG